MPHPELSFATEEPKLYELAEGDHAFAISGHLGGPIEPHVPVNPGPGWYRYGRLAVQPLEELTILLDVAPAAVWHYGLVLAQKTTPPHERGWVDASNLSLDACSEEAYVHLASRSDWEGLLRYLAQAVARLGGRVLDPLRLEGLAQRCFIQRSVVEEVGTPLSPDQLPLPFQTLLELLHDQRQRNMYGIWQPGDSYGRS